MSLPPPPRLSPAPKGAEEVDPFGDDPKHPGTITGVHRVVKHDINWLKAINVGFAAAVLSGGFAAWRAMAADARDAGTAMIAPVEKRLQVVEQQVPQLREEVFEARKDMRELQNVIITHKRSERLDEPVTPPSKDGGR